MGEIVWASAKMLDDVMEGFRKSARMITIECNKPPAAGPGGPNEP